MSRREALACMPKDGMEWDKDLQAWVQSKPTPHYEVLIPAESAQRTSAIKRE